LQRPLCASDLANLGNPRSRHGSRHGPVRHNASYDFASCSLRRGHRHRAWLLPRTMEKLVQVQQGVDAAAAWQNMPERALVWRHGREAWECRPPERIPQGRFQTLLAVSQAAGSERLCPAPAHDDGRNSFRDDGEQLWHGHLSVGALQAGCVEALPDDVFEMREYLDIQGLEDPRGAARHDQNPQASIAESLAGGGRERSAFGPGARAGAQLLWTSPGDMRAGPPSRTVPSGTEPYP